MRTRRVARHQLRAPSAGRVTAACCDLNDTDIGRMPTHTLTTRGLSASRTRLPAATSRAVLVSAALMLAATACASTRQGGGTSASTPSVTDGAELVRAMHDRYANQWYRTLTFTQAAITFPADSAPRTEIWHEGLSLPGRLRIDMEPMATRNGTVYARDSVFTVRGGSVVRAAPGFNDLLVLGFDVYAQPTDRTLAVLRQSGFDLSRVREDTWMGTPVYVVGAAAGDLRSKQFWVDRERLLFVRLIQPAGPNASGTSEIQFNRYRPVGGGWIAEEVQFFRDGRRAFLEVYYDVRTGVPLDDRLFDARAWGSVPHWTTPDASRRP